MTQYCRANRLHSWPVHNSSLRFHAAQGDLPLLGWRGELNPLLAWRGSGTLSAAAASPRK
jgi:hypothetical protein